VFGHVLSAGVALPTGPAPVSALPRRAASWPSRSERPLPTSDPVLVS